MPRIGIALVTTLCLSLPAAVLPQANLDGAPGSCDKTCLSGLADAYFAALDPAKAMAPGAKLTENAQVVKVGDGLWKSASEAPTSFKLHQQHRSEARLDCRRRERPRVRPLDVPPPDGREGLPDHQPRWNARQREMMNNPFDFESVHIFKIQGGKIHDIEAMGISLPYRSSNGWSDFLR
jgi:hypothetical protein